jgi:3-hydroxyacyl-[acyl-carrier-protein] dehydratase
VGSSTARAAIMAAIPHRDPFLFVTNVIERDATTITTEWEVPADMDVFRGHFPGNPVLPGVLISEHVFQSAAILIYESESGTKDLPGTPVLTRIQDARFKRMVKPGETLRTEVTITESLSNARFGKAKVRCGDKTVATLNFALAVTS